MVITYLKNQVADFGGICLEKSNFWWFRDFSFVKYGFGFFVFVSGVWFEGLEAWASFLRWDPSDQRSGLSV